MMFDKNFVLSVFSIFSLFVAVLYKLNGFRLVYCACSHLASAISAMLAYMCEYWPCALQSKLSRPPEISRCRAFTWVIVVPVNRVTRVIQATKDYCVCESPHEILLHGHRRLQLAQALPYIHIYIYMTTQYWQHTFKTLTTQYWQQSTVSTDNTHSRHCKYIYIYIYNIYIYIYIYIYNVLNVCCQYSVTQE